MTINQLISNKLLKYLSRVKKDFIRLMEKDSGLWTAVFRGCCDAIMKENNIPVKYLPIKESITNNENKAKIYGIQYEDNFVNRNGDAYSLCLTFDGNNFRLFTFDCAVKDDKQHIYFTEKFADGSQIIIKEHNAVNIFRLCLEVKKIINN